MKLDRVRTSSELENLRSALRLEQDPSCTYVRICMTGCRAYGAEEICSAFRREIGERGIEEKVEIVETGCHGFCARAPVLAIDPHGFFYQQVSPQDVPGIVSRSILGGEVLERLIYQDPHSGEKMASQDDIPFFRDQVKIVLRNCGFIDPARIEHYLIRDGYRALSKALTQMSPEEVIEKVKASGLRGRGGAGFPTGLKWQFTRQSPGDIKYVVCNADEGGPGVFMDRTVLEGDPHSVIEGMIVAAYAIGASTGYIYVRAEYPMAVRHLRRAIAQAEDLGLLGEDILGSGFSFTLRIQEGAGAFVCGEETALLASLEGKRGMPRLRPPFPAQSGLWGKPTNINNVETYANIAPIILQGASWYAQLGTEKSKGTKVFSLAGRINNTGLVEVPLGITLRQVVFDIGRGIPGERRFKAVQMGGPSGGCVPQQYLDLPIDYESLKGVGAIMGSGGMVVVDENTCMVDLARFCLDFVQSESCGKCVPCRLGTRRMLEIVTRISEGRGSKEDLDLLQELAEVVRDGSLCGLGQTAPNPVLTTLRYFQEEYRAHIEEKYCPACVCEALVRAPCQHACPAGVDTPSYIALIAQGNIKEALQVHLERNPLPSICGRVCHHPCGVRCRRGEIDEPIAIRALKRFMADWNGEHPLPFPQPVQVRDQRVAVVGAGPAGLSAAYHLLLCGYQVTVLEALPVAGGMLAVGIPSYRLPKEVVRREISALQDLGVDIRTGQTLGRDFTLEDLFAEGYEAIFLGLGAHQSNRLGIPGEDAQGVLQGVSFLRQLNLGEKLNLGERVVVIGGGDVAMDAARSALRLGAQEVTLLYRRSRDEMPAHKWDVQEAEEEGIKFLFLVTPRSFISQDGGLRGLQCICMELGEADESGRRRPIPVPGSEFVLQADIAIVAIGQAPDLSSLTGSGVELSPQDTIAVDPATHMTSRSGVFAGGDVVSGPATLIEAVAHGQKAAFAIDRYLSGSSRWEQELKKREERQVEVFPREEKEERREPVRVRPVEERINGFQEVVLGYDLDQAQREARRCLRCDVK